MKFEISPPAPRFVALLLLILCTASAQADSRAVQAFNYQAGIATGSHTPSGDSNSNTYGLDGAATIPLATYLGATVSGALSHTNLTNSLSNSSGGSTVTGARPSCGTNNRNLDAGLFVRDAAIGRVGVGYGVGRIQSHCNATFFPSVSDSGTLATKDYTANAEYYFSKITVALARVKTDLGTSAHLDSDTLTTSWYPINDARVGLAASGLDLKNTYGIDFEYQPDFLDNSMSLSLGYTAQRQTINTHSITVGLVYYFDTHVDLITRDRQYR
ncbi:MAG: hypothetical protein ACYDBW_09690 [Sulfuricaulis sp.]